MNHREDRLQIAVAKYLDALNIVWCHVANERKTSVMAGKRLKQKGVKSGVPDVLIFEPNKGYNGLAIELKAEVTSNDGKKTRRPKPTNNQLLWLNILSKKGWKTEICYNFDEVLFVVNAYFK